MRGFTTGVFCLSLFVPSFALGDFRGYPLLKDLVIPIKEGTCVLDMSTPEVEVRYLGEGIGGGTVYRKIKRLASGVFESTESKVYGNAHEMEMDARRLEILREAVALKKDQLGDIHVIEVERLDLASRTMEMQDIRGETLDNIYYGENSPSIRRSLTAYNYEQVKKIVDAFKALVRNDSRYRILNLAQLPSEPYLPIVGQIEVLIEYREPHWSEGDWFEFFLKADNFVIDGAGKMTIIDPR